MSAWDLMKDMVTNWLSAPYVSWTYRFAWTGDDTKEDMSANSKYPTPKSFLDAIEPYAQAVEAKYKIPWLFTATQAAHESRYGNSQLAIEAYNLFGVTGDSWKAEGKPIYEISTMEYDQKEQTFKLQRPFRKYASYRECLEDWAALIVRRYAKAYSAALIGDFTGFARGLQDGGYATDPQYAMQLENMHTLLEATV